MEEVFGGRVVLSAHFQVLEVEECGVRDGMCLSTGALCRGWLAAFFSPHLYHTVF